MTLARSSKRPALTAMSSTSLLRSQPFGAHLSVAGGIENAFYAGKKLGFDCLQIFVKNQRQWAAAPLSDEAVAVVHRAAQETGLSPVVAHATYLLNLASPDAVLRRRSVTALVAEIARCARLHVPFLVLHPGAHMGRGVDAGIKRIVTSLNEVFRHTEGLATQVLLETTAGQGTSIGHQIEHLARIIGAVRNSDRLGVCLDTCHVFAAGYDITREQGYQRLLGELDGSALLARVKCIHTNDSKHGCSSRLDRHEHITKGKIGKAGFRRLMNDPRLAHVPKILETPKGVDGRGTDLDRVNIKRLRNLIE